MIDFQMKLDFPQDRDDSFQNFILGLENQTCAELCRRFASLQEGEPKSLVIHGPTLSGKTHLLSAMGKVASRRVGARAAIYIDCAALTGGGGELDIFGRLKEYVSAMDQALFLTVDQLELAQENEELASLVFHLYNEVTARPGGRFAAALSVDPAGWSFPQWLSTRLLWGNVAKLRPVGDEARPQVLIKMAADMRMTLPSDAALWLVTRLPRDPSSQAQTLARIDRLSLTKGKKISIPLIKEVVRQADGR
ncbi:MAG: DnaA/Hda family protein [Nitrospinota bacterium]|nr:DnaA/Hda family protein [Nitrospinota bacterium]